MKEVRNSRRRASLPTQSGGMVPRRRAFASWERPENESLLWIVPCPQGEMDAARKCSRLKRRRFLSIESWSMIESQAMSDGGVVARKVWKFVGMSGLSFAWGRSSLLRLPVAEGLTVDRMLENIARHCSALIVFCTIFARLSDSLRVEELSLR